jgi:hypothetical protein
MDMSSISKYEFEYAGKIHKLNERLVTRLGVSDENLEEIKRLHWHKLALFDDMVTNESSEVVLRNKKLYESYVYAIEQIEFKLQELWGFTQNRDFHYWFDVPLCTCPKMDNRERYGTPYRIISGDCKLHGGN